jgi:hypothetical protein
VALVAVPVLAPFTVTDIPSTALPELLLVTFPETLICCATALPIMKSSKTHESKDFFMSDRFFC